MILSALHNLVAGFLRRTWLVAVVAVIACAAFAARAVAAFIVADQLVPAPRGVPPTPHASPAPIPRPPPNGDVLVERNIFCSSCAPIPGSGPTNGSSAGDPVVLIATSVGAPVTARSRAILRVVPTGLQGSWRVGESIPGVGRVDQIGHAMIDVVDDAGHRRRISLLDGPEAAGHVAAGAATPEHPGPPPDPFADRVKKIDDTTFEVARQLVRDLVSGAAKPNGARAVPLVDAGGEVKGVRMLGVRTGSVAAALGLRTGDVIASIDGDPIRNVQQLLDLFARLDQISSVQLAGTRAGKPLGLTLRLR